MTDMTEAEDILRALVEAVEREARERAQSSTMKTSVCVGCRVIRDVVGTVALIHDHGCPYWQARRFLDGIGR